MYSVFDIFKIGIGPSSSHTVGPMKAAKQFSDELIENGLMDSVTRVDADIYGSLSLTGKGHHTDIAIIMGLNGNNPDTVNIDSIPTVISDAEKNEKLAIGPNGKIVDFPIGSVRFHETVLEKHENGMQVHAYAGKECVYSKTYYSVGGGFIVEDSEFGKELSADDIKPISYDFNSAAELLAQCKEHGLSISALVHANELQWRTQDEIDANFDRLWEAMSGAVQRGSETEGILAGPLRVPRRAAQLKRALEATEHTDKDPMTVIDWVNMFALAASEENAAGGRVVTAPTNGAAGIIPAVLSYYDKFIKKLDRKEYSRFYLTAGVIGVLYHTNASISGAEVGCQGEVGVACSMAAAGLADLMGASPEQICVAAEIGMEHHLGMTCDPVAGQVQVPCIERNAIASVKAVNAARMALRRNSQPTVCLDKVIATMYATGKDMNAKYRETSQGGLAIKVLMQD
ncbi:L-serine ammonia-lyase [Paraferrimonas sp. SM1919]|uniref:L-serine ammonia-lyase n=1 Tax=Paraferrimonas sp. SM1919 TaxID=2662263 RepID=UPI0013D72F7A|nr:L-serine ammonia-lyase [Paraferrimonas sp. SM1919]